MDAALLAGAHADGLTVLDVADRVGLGVFQGDEADDQVNFGALGQLLVLGDNVLEHFLVNFEEIVSLLKDHAEDLTASLGSG